MKKFSPPVKKFYTAPGRTIVGKTTPCGSAKIPKNSRKVVRHPTTPARYFSRNVDEFLEEYETTRNENYKPAVNFLFTALGYILIHALS